MNIDVEAAIDELEKTFSDEKITNSTMKTSFESNEKLSKESSKSRQLSGKTSTSTRNILSSTLKEDARVCETSESTKKEDSFSVIDKTTSFVQLEAVETTTNVIDTIPLETNSSVSVKQAEEIDEYSMDFSKEVKTQSLAGSDVVVDAKSIMTTHILSSEKIDEKIQSMVEFLLKNLYQFFSQFFY